MTKITHVLAAAALAALGANAYADPSFYIGGGVLAGSGSLKDTVTSTTLDNDTSGTRLKLGYITADGNRLELSYSSVDLKFPTVKRKVSGIDIDYLWTFGSSSFKPYLGIGLGAYTFEDSAQFFTDNKDLSGVALNLSAGLIFEVVSSVDLEAAVRRKSIESQEVQSGSTKGTWNQTMTNVYLGANIKF